MKMELILSFVCIYITCSAVCVRVASCFFFFAHLQFHFLSIFQVYSHSHDCFASLIFVAHIIMFAHKFHIISQCISTNCILCCEHLISSFRSFVLDAFEIARLRNWLLSHSNLNDHLVLLCASVLHNFFCFAAPPSPLRIPNCFPQCCSLFYVGCNDDVVCVKRFSCSKLCDRAWNVCTV